MTKYSKGKRPEMIGDLVLLDGHPVAYLIEQSDAYSGANLGIKGEFRERLRSSHKISIMPKPHVKLMDEV